MGSSDDMELPLMDPLIEAVTTAVRVHMSRYDGSHDFSHIRRVVGTAGYLAKQEMERTAKEGGGSSPPLDLRIVALCALLHDVGDRKYLHLVPEEEEAVHPDKTDASTGNSQAEDTESLSAIFPDDPGARAIAAVLRRCGASADLVRLVPVLCQHISWTTETKSEANARATADLIAKHPELAVVQDADRLDSIGSIGFARCFAYGGACQGGRTLQASLDHFDVKLFHVYKRMKTAAGRALAEERTERLRTMKGWFEDEAAFMIPESS